MLYFFFLLTPVRSLSWADTAASTFGRLWGRYTPPLPRRLPLLGLPFAPRKSLAGFIAACITGALVAIGFWGLMAPLGAPDQHLSWTWKEGFRMMLSPSIEAVAEQIGVKGVVNTGGWVGLAIIGLFAGLVSGVAEALGEC
jgi:diacylglycerol kinase (CTP)